MTVHIQGQTMKATQDSWAGVKRIPYDYPEGLKIVPGSELHTNIVNLIMERAQESYRIVQERHDSWNQIARSLTAYTRPDDKSDWEEKQKSSPVIIPITFATLETILTYMTATFLDTPIFRFGGRSPEDTVGAALLEHVIATQNDFSNIGLNLHTQWRNAFAFGFGPSAVSWKKTIGKRSTYTQPGKIAEFFGATSERELEEYTIFEGNEMIDLDPFKYLPDPNVPVHDVQAGEFVGWFERTNRMALLSQERQEPDVYFNAKYLVDMNQLLSGLFKEGGRTKQRNSDLNQEGDVTNPVDVVHMYIELVPSEHKLSKTDYPEKWKFAIASDSLVLEARPLNLSHNLYPIVVAAPDFDGYSPTPASRLEILYGLQDSIDWLFSSHIANVRKAINDMIIADPSRVNLNDLANPRAGKIIRTRRAYWGRGVKDVAEQFKINDVTQGHMKDTAVIKELMNQISSASDMGQGSPMRSGERISATEVKGIQQGSMSRLAKSARIISMQSMLPMARMMATHTQDFMEDETYINITGELAEVIASELGREVPPGVKFPIRPEDLAVAYDVKAHDGTMAGTQDVQAWTQLWQVFGSSPHIAQNFDIVRIFKHIARQMGVKNVNDFVRTAPPTQTQMMPDEQVNNEVDKGNLVPV